MAEKDQLRLIYLRIERWQVVRFRKQAEGKTFHKLHVLRMNDDLWDDDIEDISITIYF